MGARKRRQGWAETRRSPTFPTFVHLFLFSLFFFNQFEIWWLYQSVTVKYNIFYPCEGHYFYFFSPYGGPFLGSFPPLQKLLRAPMDSGVVANKHELERSKLSVWYYF